VAISCLSAMSMLILVLSDLTWRTVDETTVIPVDPSQPLDLSLFEQYDICITGAALKQYESRPAWNDLVQNTWVYARVSPAQKEFILTSLKSLGYTTLMAGDGTNDVGALKQAHIGVALLDGTPEDLQKIAEHQRIERIKKVYESQLNISSRFNQPPPPVPPAIAHLYPDVVEAQQKAAADLQTARKKNPLEKVRLLSISLSISNGTHSRVVSLIWHPSPINSLRWTPMRKCQRSSLEMPLAPRLSRRNCPMSLPVGCLTKSYRTRD
jgi:manganese-transporting P-type ATPase